MKLFTDVNALKEPEVRIHMMHEHNGPVRPIPPHERRAMVHIEFDEGDWQLLRDIFGDEDTAAATAAIIRGAPPEIQVLAVQLIHIMKEVA